MFLLSSEVISCLISVRFWLVVLFSNSGVMCLLSLFSLMLDRC